MSENSLILSRVDDSQADTLIGEFADASWRQCPAYACAAAAQIRAVSEYVKITHGDELVALANVRIKKLPVVGTGIAFISHGPMVVRKGGEFDGVVFCAVLRKLSEYYSETRKLCLRIEPHVYADALRDAVKTGFANAGFTRQAGNGYQTFMIDLAPDLETLRKKLNGKWRTDLNRGERGGLRITRSSEAEDFDRFAPLLEQLADKKGFLAPQDAKFFKNVAAQAGLSDNITVHLAWNGDELVGGHIGSFTGDTAVYLLGATTDKGRNLRASYVLQWAVMEHAKSLGMARYDLGGVDEKANPAVHRFKKRMGGIFVENLVICEKMPAQPHSAIIKGAEYLYRKIKG
ncbi:peptidoglycan bridge formation glycyltransferase FemA/FemB family protein [Sphingorhabdus sp. Alg239-R122]|uniref:lipid II:glycine glycyltransferase FemX n=1 Tax=Sphingorhabdus sp. Alg239-R122 TaxID=2305989 RepID=UPI0013D8EB77|nr:peptidoglycan bridge formation glycyltransferase FemA/FemB family protein [Sphingorhabdus sp. Alg239-R122]